MRLGSLLAFVLAIAALGCTATPAASPTPTQTPTPTGSPTGTPFVAPTPSDVPTVSPSPSPLDSDAAIVKIEQVGGMMPPWVTARFYPSVVLYGDGRLIMQGAQILIYPGPALPSLQVTRLTPSGIEQVLAWAVDAGLAGPNRELGEPILDAGTWFFTVAHPEGVHQTSITDLTQPDAAIAAASEFHDVLRNIRQWLPDDIEGEDTAYEWDRLRVISWPADPATIEDPALVTQIDWPLDDLAGLGQSLSEPADYRCFVLEGDAVETLRPMLEEANELTLWLSGGEAYQLGLRPLLPDEEGCPGF